MAKRAWDLCPPNSSLSQLGKQRGAWNGGYSLGVLQGEGPAQTLEDYQGTLSAVTHAIGDRPEQVQVRSRDPLEKDPGSKELNLHQPTEVASLRG